MPLEASMDEKVAFEAYRVYRAQQGLPAQPKSTVAMADGSWLFVEIAEAPPGRFEGVAGRADGRIFPFFGALGKVLRAFEAKLGAPRSGERFLGATCFGRYQAFNDGIAIWEGREDIGFPVLESWSPLRRQLSLVAFFDLRGFTSWSQAAGPNKIQEAIMAFEEAVYDGFPVDGAPWDQLFLKGTGDGVMIVSQADWYRGAKVNEPMTVLMRGHARDFLHACERAVVIGRDRFIHIRFPLAIGCGIASGDLDRVFLFGRFDFIGAAANEAAKLQQHAWNEVCVTRDFGALLGPDGWTPDAAWALATRGWRLRPT